MTDKIYGIVQCFNGNTIGGISLQEVKDLIKQVDNQQVDFYDLLGDLAVAPKIMKDLVEHVEELIEQSAIDHEQAGITINYEMVKMQSIAMGHGQLATLAAVKTTLGEDSEEFKAIQQVVVARVAQNIQALLGCGLTAQEANARILQGN